MFFEKMQNRKNDGFTLVELIVVIAILAILAGIGVPAYSGYVEKANMAADQQLAGEVANALTLYYYDNYKDTPSGYVTITKDGITASNDGMTAALNAVYGEEGWQDQKLKADWTGATGTSMLNYAIDRATADMEATQKVNDSTFLNEASTDGMLNALTEVSNIVNGVINTYSGDVATKLDEMLPGLTTSLTEAGVNKDDPAYNTAVSNMMVGYFANALHTNSDPEDNLTQMVQTYATMYAYAESIGDTTAMNTINETLKNVDSTDDLNAFTLFAAFPEGSKFTTGYDEYMGNEETGKGFTTDLPATLEIMGALSEISDSYKNKESLTNPNLYNSDSIRNQANEYVNAVKIVAGMSTEDLANLKTTAASGNVVVSMAGGIAAISPAMF